MNWRLNVLSSNLNQVTTFMDPIDKHIQIKGNFICCDALLMFCFLAPQLVKKGEKHHVAVETAGSQTRGQMIIDHKEIEVPNAFIIKEIYADKCVKFFLWICNHDVKDFD